jgi:hypothetical protein
VTPASAQIWALSLLNGIGQDSRQFGLQAAKTTFRGGALTLESLAIEQVTAAI